MVASDTGFGFYPITALLSAAIQEAAVPIAFRISALETLVFKKLPSKLAQMSKLQDLAWILSTTVKGAKKRSKHYFIDWRSNLGLARRSRDQRHFTRFQRNYGL